MNSGKLVQNACKSNQNSNGTDMNCSVVGCSLVKDMSGFRLAKHVFGAILHLSWRAGQAIARPLGFIVMS
jgi:hypothetical protein